MGANEGGVVGLQRLQTHTHEQQQQRDHGVGERGRWDHKPRNTWSHCKTSMNRFSPRALRGCIILLTP